MTTILGTTQLAIAFTIFAPARMMPVCSESRPTMKPVVSCRKMMGILRWLQSMMKRADLSAESS